MSNYPPFASSELKTFLRPAHEPLRFIGDDLVHAILLSDPCGYLDYLEHALRDIATGQAETVLPPKEVFADGAGRGDFRIMPCVTRRAGRTVKTVKIVGTNLAQRLVPDQVTVGKAMLLHPEENFVTHLFDANALSSIRTGACVALAIRLLAAEQCRLFCCGCGRVGFYSAVFALTLKKIESVHFFDIVPGRAESLAAFLARHHSDKRFTAGPLGPQDRADVVVLATTAVDPPCRPPGWGARLIVSVGADTDYQHELDPAWAGCGRLYVDTRDTARFGDLRQWLQGGLIRPEDLRDFFDLLCDPSSADGPCLFVSTGSALFDNLTMAYLAERLPPDFQSSDTKSSNL